MQDDNINSLLDGYRVLDLTDWRGWLCGRLLGDLGADVIKVESRGGDQGRSLGPFVGDTPDESRSLVWLAYNVNKRGITLNLETADGRHILKEMAAKADFLIESLPVGYLDGIGLGYEALRQVNQRLVMTSISAFGQAGPYSQLKASDLIVTAISGLLSVVGDPDRPPVASNLPQAYLHASLDAAVGTMIAHYYREISGEGQYVDASAQASLVGMQVTSLPYWEFNEQITRRTGGRSRMRAIAGLGPRTIYRCQDGYFAFQVFGGMLGAHSNRELVKWMDEDGLAPDFLKAKDWESFDLATATREELDQMGDAFDRFFERYTKAELLEGTLQRGIMSYPVFTAEEICADPQLASRDYWVHLSHDELGQAITYPGVFAKLSETPLKLRRRAPLIGEHNEEIFIGELGLTREQLRNLKQAGVI